VLSAVVAAVPLRNWDYWYHAAVGRLLAQHRAVPTSNVFGFSAPADTPVLISSWLGDYWLFRLHEMGGLVPSIATRNFCVMACWAAIAWCVYRLSDNNGRAAAIEVALAGFTFLALCAFAGPQMFAWPLFGALAAVLVASRSWTKARWLVVPVTGVVAALWANLADGFWVPAVMAAIFAGAARLQKESPLPYLLAAVVGAAGMLATPHGPGIARALFSPTGLETWLVLGAAVALGPLLRSARPMLHEVPALAGAAVCGLIVIISIVLQPISGHHSAIPAAVFGEQVRQQQPLMGYGPADTPIEAVELLRTRGGQPRVYASPHLSGYLLYELQDPHRPAPIVWGVPDHPESDKAAKVHATLGTDPEVTRGVLHQLDIKAVIVTEQLRPSIADQLASLPEWEKVGEWPSATLYLRVR
jgi:hypothetical protein